MLLKNVLQRGFADGNAYYFHLKLSLFHPWFSCWVIDCFLHKHPPTVARCSHSPLCPGMRGSVCQRSASCLESWALPAGYEGSIGNSNYTGYLNRDIWWLRRQRICLQSGRPGFDPWFGKIPWRRKRQPTPVFLPAESHGQRSLVGYRGAMGSQRVRHDWATKHSKPI